MFTSAFKTSAVRLCSPQALFHFAGRERIHSARALDPGSLSCEHRPMSPRSTVNTILIIVAALSFSLSVHAADLRDALGFGKKSTNQSSSLASGLASSLSQDQVIEGL